MRTTLKIFLVLATCFAVVGTLLFYVKTRLSPPQPLADDHPHIEMALQRVSNVREGLDESTLNARFFEARHLLAFLGDNGLLTEEESNQLKGDLVERYAPLYADKCINYFRGSYWEDDAIRRMERQIAVAKRLRLADGTCVVECNKEAESRLNGVLDVVCRYDSAKLLAKGGTYQNWPNTKRRMARARRFMNDEFLGNNEELVQSLDSFRYRLEKSHYDHLGIQVGRLSGFHSMSKNDFDSLCVEVETEISLYADSARTVYGIEPRRLDSIRSVLRSYKSQAYGYHITRDATEKIVNVGRSILNGIFE